MTSPVMRSFRERRVRLRIMFRIEKGVGGYPMEEGQETVGLKKEDNKKFSKTGKLKNKSEMQRPSEAVRCALLNGSAWEHREDVYEKVQRYF